MLQAQFAILCGPTSLLKEEEIGIIMIACVIQHNMIIEDECNNSELAFDYDIVEETTAEPIVSREHHPYYETYFQDR